MSWLNDVVIQHEEFESPRSFWFWGALSAISAVVKDNIWFDKYLYKTYPNIYVMLLADSGLKKGPPISMAKQLVRAVGNTRVITGRSSIQGILKKLATAETKPGGIIVGGSAAFICSSELSSSVVDDKAANKIFTDLYDRNYNFGDWESLLKMEAFQLRDATVSMFTGTNDAQNKDLFSQVDITGGYFARTFLIHEKEAANINSLMFKPTYIPDYTKTAEYLKQVAKLRGPFQMSDETRKFVDDWYHKLKRDMKEQELKDSTGTMNRFDDSVLKVASLISLGEKPELIISQSAVERAIEECTKLIGSARRASMGTGKSVWTQEKALVIGELVDRNSHAITRQQLNNKFWMRANASEWDEIMLSLEVAGIITIEAVGSNILYKMPSHMVEEWRNHLRGK